MSDFFKAASFFVGGSALIFWLSVVCLSLFIFLHTTTVMKICGWMHIFGGKMRILIAYMHITNHYI